MHCKAFEILIETIWMPLCASVTLVHTVYPIRIYLSLFSFCRLAVYLKVLMLECLYFSHATGSLVLNSWVYDATVGVLLKCFAPASVVVCKHLFCNALWLTIFCAPALFDCAFDMDPVSEIKHYHHHKESIKVPKLSIVILIC